MTLHRALEAGSILVLLTMAAVVAVAWGRLPQTVPVHFGWPGVPDARGSRYRMLVLPTIGAAIYVGLTLLGRIPHRFNYPVRISPENAARQRALAGSLTLWVKLEVMALFLVLTLGAVRVSLRMAEALNVRLMYAVIGLLLLTVAVYVARAVRAR